MGHRRTDNDMLKSVYADTLHKIYAVRKGVVV